MKITLCGSTRFHERYKELNAILSKQGHVVYAVAVAEKAGDPLTEAEKVTLDLVHLKKILESDAIVIIGHQPDNTYYIGDSTRRELEWAMLNDKNVFLEKAWGFQEGKVTSIETNVHMVHPMKKMLKQIAGACEAPSLLQDGGEA